jgi:hypothetical protein
MTRLTIAVAVLALGSVTASVAFGDVPSLVNYQGILTDSGGHPLAGQYDLTFRIYPDSLAATPAMWTEVHLDVDVDEGLFNVILGSNSGLTEAVFASPERWLGITVEADPEITPRMRITSAPWAFRAAIADSALSTASLPPHDHDDRYYTEGELNAAGTINDPSNPVDWTKLKSVPAGLADGVDDVGAGDGHSLDADDGSPEDVVYVDQDGFVGIGIAPMLGTKLYVNGDVKVTYSDGFYVGAYKAVGWTADANVALGGQVETIGTKLFSGSTTPSMILEAGTGRVGIGTETPAALLNVAGELQIDATSGRALDVIHTTTGGGQTINFWAEGDLSSANDMLQIYIGEGSSNTCQFIECERGLDREFAVYGDGNVYADGSYTGPADFSEMIAVSTGAATAEPGDVMVIEPGSARAIVKCSEPRSTLVAGIYSTRPGFIGSEREWDRPGAGDDATDRVYTLEAMASEFDEIPLAVVGIVPCRVSAENGAIRPGDLLVTSSTPGHAMRDADPGVGTVLGKALEALPSGTGVIKVLVTLQ